MLSLKIIFKKIVPQKRNNKPEIYTEINILHFFIFYILCFTINHKIVVKRKIASIFHYRLNNFSRILIALNILFFLLLYVTFCEK